MSYDSDDDSLPDLIDSTGPLPAAAAAGPVAERSLEHSIYFRDCVDAYRKKEGSNLSRMQVVRGFKSTRRKERSERRQKMKEAGYSKSRY